MIDTKQARDKRIKLEQNIMKLIAEFEEETGLTCDEVDYIRSESVTKSPYGHRIVTGSYAQISVTVKI